MLRKNFIFAFCFIIFSSLIAAQERDANESNSEKSDWSLYLTTDFAYYPESDYVSGGDHFAPVTGFCSGVELRTTFNADYKFLTPLGKSWLVKDAFCVFGSAFEISPISIRPKISFSFTPFPFLVLSSGASLGTGWNMFTWKGLAELDEEKSREDAEYDNLQTFVNYYYDFWLSGTFQFDTGALFSGDWTHVLLLASYKSIYKGITGIENKKIWSWMNSGNNANGLQYEASFVIAYQMPLLLYRVGFMCDIDGHYKSSDYGSLSDSYNGDFINYKLSPFVQLNFGEKDSLYCLLSFENRRSFEENHDSEIEETYLTYSGNEWHFYRLALSWTHKI